MGVRAAVAALFLLVLLPAGVTAAPPLHVQETLRVAGDPAKAIFTQAWIPAEPRGLVVYTHGFTDNSRNHTALVRFLNSLGYAVAAWDLPGHGTSYGMRGYVDSFDEFLAGLDLVRRKAQERVPQGTPVYMAGYSLGALVTLRYSQLHDHEIAGSFYVSPFLKAHLSFMRRLLNAFSKPLDRLLPRVETPHGVIVPMLASDPAIQAERATDPYFFTKMTVRLFRQLLSGIDDVKAGASRITRPLLFLVAGRELIVERSETDRFYARLRPGLRKSYQLYPEMLHELDNCIGREQVFDALGAWLHDQERSGAFRTLHTKPKGS